MIDSFVCGSSSLLISAFIHFPGILVLVDMTVATVILIYALCRRYLLVIYSLFLTCYRAVFVFLFVSLPLIMADVTGICCVFRIFDVNIFSGLTSVLQNKPPLLSSLGA